MIKKLLIPAMIAAGFYTNAQTVVFQENFQPATAALWGNTDRDGDGEKWEFLNAELNEVLSFQGDFAVSFSWYLEAFSPDNALTSPEINLPNTDGIQLSFKVAAGDEELFDEHYAVYVIPANSAFTGAETPVFEETLDAGYTLAAKNISVNISSFKGQNVKLVFRHFNCTDIFYMGIDDVQVSQNALAVSDLDKKSFTVYPNPASDFIKISNAEKIDKIRIFDMSSRLIKETSDKEINVQNFAKGQYILNIHTGNQIISERFIKK